MFKEVRGMDSAICKLAHDRYYYRECVWKVRFEESFCGWQARCSYYVSGDDSCYFCYVCVWENIFDLNFNFSRGHQQQLLCSLYMQHIGQWDIQEQPERSTSSGQES